MLLIHNRMIYFLATEGTSSKYMSKNSSLQDFCCGFAHLRFFSHWTIKTSVFAIKGLGVITDVDETVNCQNSRSWEVVMSCLNVDSF